MKKLLLSAFVLFLTVTTISAKELKENEVSGQVLKTFQKEFMGVQKVSWQEVGDLYQAVFVYNDERISAYFDEEGHFLATMRNVFQKQLPLTVSKSLNKQYKDYYILSVVEKSTPENVSYIIMVEKDGEKSLLNAGTDGFIYRIRKIK